MNTLEYIVNKYKLSVNGSIVEIPNTNRESFAYLLAELQFNKGAEIGVEEGKYSEVLCKANPNLFLSCIDAWTAYTGYRDHVDQDKVNRIYEAAKKRLDGYNGVLIKAFSTEAAKGFEDESLDFVYIDANHEFTHVVNDIAAWEPKVKVGGIVAGHDYIKRKSPNYLMHVPMALHGYCESYDIKPVFILGARDAKPGELRDSTRSWFYVRQARLPTVPGHNMVLTSDI